VPFLQLPDVVQQMYLHGTVLAHLPLDQGPTGSGYYLANFAVLNNEITPHRAGPRGGVYRLRQSEWFNEKQPLNHMFWPGNSAFVLEMLNRGTAIAYVTKAARTMDCFCYVLNLASLNGKDIFDPTPDANPKCEVRTDGAAPSG